MKRCFLLLSLLLVGVLAMPACSEGRQDKAPSFSLKTSDGQVIDLEKLKGKVVILNFWATWCGPCKQEIPGFIDTYNKLHAKGVEIVGVSVDEGGWDVVRPYVSKANIPYPVVLGDEALRTAYGGISAIPTTFIINKEGNIMGKHVGFLTSSQLEKQINAVL